MPPDDNRQERPHFTPVITICTNIFKLLSIIPNCVESKHYKLFIMLLYLAYMHPYPTNNKCICKISTIFNQNVCQHSCIPTTKATKIYAPLYLSNIYCNTKVNIMLTKIAPANLQATVHLKPNSYQSKQAHINGQSPILAIAKNQPIHHIGLVLLRYSVYLTLLF